MTFGRASRGRFVFVNTECNYTRPPCQRLGPRHFVERRHTSAPGLASARAARRKRTLLTGLRAGRTTNTGVRRGEVVLNPLSRLLK